MKNEAALKYYILNGRIFKAEDSTGFEFIKPPHIYEVVRVMDGVALFEEAHIERMKSSIELLNYSMKILPGEIAEMIQSLIMLNGVKNQNIKLVYGNLEEEYQSVLIYFVNSSYPPSELYETGIKTILFESERENPNAKVINQDLREAVIEELYAEEAFEALLVDYSGNITEGSKSNFFYVKDNALCTPPAEKVLLGITRSEIIEAAKAKGIELIELPLNVEDLSKIEGAFISGTSIDALPIALIEDIALDSADNPIIVQIIEGYREKVESYIAEKLKSKA